MKGVLHLARNNANLGMAFQKTVDYACQQYESKGWAVFHEVPTSWKVIRQGRRIVEAFPEKKSIVDFLGIADGRGLAFDAKTTRERTRFPLANVEEHQVQFLRKYHDQGGIAFLIVEFAVLREVYAVPFKEFEKWWIAASRGGRQSIPISEFRLGFDRVRSARGIALDFLPVVQSWQRAA